MLFEKLAAPPALVAARAVLLLAVAVSTTHCASSPPLVTLSASQQRVRDRGEAVEFEGAELMLRLGGAIHVCIDPGRGAKPLSIACLQGSGWDEKEPGKDDVVCCDAPRAWRIHYDSTQQQRAFQGVLYRVHESEPTDPFYFSVYVPEPQRGGDVVAKTCSPAPLETTVAKSAPEPAP
jgi:hypothetical protein